MRKLLYGLLFTSLATYSQTTVNVDLQEERILGTTSKLDRSKFFTFHSNADWDSQIASFMDEYEVGLGRRFNGPFGFSSSNYGVGNYPNYITGTTDHSVRDVKRFVSTAHTRNVLRYNLDVDEAANWAVEYWLDIENDGTRPEFWEPMNEPFIRSGDAIFSSDQPDGNLVRIRMAEWFRTLARKVHETPELANMKVVGYSSAWPSMERFNFGHWTSRMKMFIDVAGNDMDAISVHPYDGVNVTGQDNRRSGSNCEAILDLIETYTAQKFGSPKNLAITEYGIIESGYPAGYNEAESAISIRGINSMLFNFMERQDNIAISIPFITGKSSWYYSTFKDTPYVPALYRPLSQNPLGNWEYSYKINFYELWKGVNGNRSFVESTNPDIQAQSFVDGNDAYIALNNLDDEDQTVTLNIFGNTSSISNVELRSLKIYNDANPSYTIFNSAQVPANLVLQGGETVVLKVSYASVSSFTKSITRTKYYATPGDPNANPTIPIMANTAHQFQVTDVNVGDNGIATLRIGVGRDHEYSKLPSQVSINGTPVPELPTNWGGYDQANRLQFFGVIEVAVPYNLLQENDNTITVTYPDSGGRLSSVVLEVERRIDCPTVTWSRATNPEGAWTPEAPSQNTRVVINADYNTANQEASIDACELVINENTTLTIEADDYVNVVNGITVNGTLDVKHTGSLVQEKELKAINNGTIHVNLTTPSLNARDYMLLGSPMTEEKNELFNAYQVLNHTTENFNQYEGDPPVIGVNFYDQELDDWSSHSGTLNPGEAYIVRPSYTEDGTYSYTYNKGTLNNGDTSYTVGFNDSKTESPNYISNPYPSAISAVDFINDNPLVDELYLWEHLTTPNPDIPGPLSQNFSMEDISTFNGLMGIPAANDMTPDQVTTPNGIISTGQGFGIKANNSGDVVFTNSMRRKTGNTTLRSSETDNFIWLTVRESQYNMGSTTAIGFTDRATSAFDASLDTEKLGTVVSLYSHLPDGTQTLGIQGREVFDDTMMIPIGFSTQIEESISYTISINALKGAEIENSNIYLIDTFTDEITDISISSYTFESNATIDNNRFILQFNEASLNTEVFHADTIQIYPNPTDNFVTVKTINMVLKGIEITDVRGRIILSETLNNQSIFQLDVTSLTNTMYFMTLETDKGKTTKRILKK